MQIITSKPKYFRTKTSLKTVAITALEWFDRVNGNSYFSARIIVNGKYQINLPYQYGYGDHCVDMACKELSKLGLTDKNLYRWDNRQHLEFNHTKIENCIKRELMNFVK